MLASCLEDETVQQQRSQLWLALILVPLSLALSLPSLPDWASKPTLAGIGVLEVQQIFRPFRLPRSSSSPFLPPLPDMVPRVNVF